MPRVYAFRTGTASIIEHGGLRHAGSVRSPSRDPELSTTMGPTPPLVTFTVVRKPSTDG